MVLKSQAVDRWGQKHIGEDNVKGSSPEWNVETVFNEAGSTFFFRVFETKIPDAIYEQNLYKNFSQAKFCTPF